MSQPGRTDPYGVPTTRRPSLAALVPAVRREVDAWRAGGYPGASATTRRLLEHWFLDEHETAPGVPFRYYFAQREAVESVIYLYEVLGVRSPQQLRAHFDIAIAADTDFARFVIKMATGSGKTKVMSLLIAWAYLHATLEAGSDLPTTFLLVAPNIIVYERLREDFANGAIFRRPGRPTRVRLPVRARRHAQERAGAGRRAGRAGGDERPVAV